MPFRSRIAKPPVDSAATLFALRGLQEAPRGPDTLRILGDERDCGADAVAPAAWRAGWVRDDPARSHFSEETV